MPPVYDPEMCKPMELELINVGVTALRSPADVDQALADGFSTAGSLGYGLGTVNRLMDELDITSYQGPGSGTGIVCRRWLREQPGSATACPLAFGAATRPHPHMAENGDAFVIKQWAESALVGVVDGLGHGQFACRAAPICA